MNAKTRRMFLDDAIHTLHTLDMRKQEGRIERISKNGIRITVGKPTRPRGWKCAVCGKDTMDDYFAKNETWKEAGGKPKDLMHFACFAKKLGRPLTLDDFPKCLANSVVRFFLARQR